MTFEESVHATAKELINKYRSFYPFISEQKKLDDTKRCALIAVDAQKDAISGFCYFGIMWDKPYKDKGSRTGEFSDAEYYYEQIKQAIINYK